VLSPENASGVLDLSRRENLCNAHDRPNSAQYARARELGYLSMADEIIDISDDGLNDWIERRRADGSTETVVNHEHISRSKLRFDARRWLLSKCLPKIYGDRLEHTGPDGGPIQVTVARFTETEGGT